MRGPRRAADLRDRVAVRSRVRRALDVRELARRVRAAAMSTSEISAITAPTAARVSCAAPTPGVAVAAASRVSPHVEAPIDALAWWWPISASSDRADRVCLPGALRTIRSARRQARILRVDVRAAADAARGSTTAYAPPPLAGRGAVDVIAAFPAGGASGELLRLAGARVFRGARAGAGACPGRRGPPRLRRR